MKLLYLIFLLSQLYLIGQLLTPFLLTLLAALRSRRESQAIELEAEPDYAIIVTAYGQTHQLPAVIDSLLQLDYHNYLIYLVADNCGDTPITVANSDRIIVLRPDDVLASNVKSHFYAI